ncbi:MAG: DUF4173 domain-containing protein [Bacteroidia bacterium]|nr:DUF4173 domain-containing protein [Bacteroidia bacterium]
MKKKLPVLLAFATAILFTLLFHWKGIGINLLLLEWPIFAWLFFSGEFKFKGLTATTSGVAFLATGLGTVLTHSLFSYVLHFISVFIFTGVLTYPAFKSLMSAIGAAFMNLFESQIRFFTELNQREFKARKVFNLIWRSRIFTIPMLVIAVFILIYGLANPVFGELVSNIRNNIGQGWTSVFQDFDGTIVFTFLLGLYFSNLIYLRVRSEGVVQADTEAVDQLLRQRKRRTLQFSPNSLKNELRAGIFLLIILNALLLTLNIIDVNGVWFNFQWNGFTLKHFVHEGTYLLILSILISGALVLYFFRGNLNFYANNKLLKYLSYAWIAQNAILTLSVAMRNFYYISHFSLAYKRIGVIIFLLLTFYGLWTVFRKVSKQRSGFYILRMNTLTVFIVLSLASLVNWDSVIARYNFRHADQAFLHLEYLAGLSDKALPYLDKPLPELLKIDEIQRVKFPAEQIYMSPNDYFELIQYRKQAFKTHWESKSWLAWNLPEYLAYRAF